MKKATGRRLEPNPFDPFSAVAAPPDPNARSDSQPDTPPEVAACPLTQAGESFPVRLLAWQLPELWASDLSDARVDELAQLILDLDVDVCFLLGIRECTGFETVVREEAGGRYVGLKERDKALGPRQASRLADALAKRGADEGWQALFPRDPQTDDVHFYEGFTAGLLFRTTAPDHTLSVSPGLAPTKGVGAPALNVSRQWLGASFTVNGTTVETGADMTWELPLAMSLAGSRALGDDELDDASTPLPKRCALAFSSFGDLHEREKEYREFLTQLEPSDAGLFGFPEGTALRWQRWDAVVARSKHWLLHDPRLLPLDLQDQHMSWSYPLEQHYDPKTPGDDPKIHHCPDKAPTQADELLGGLTTVGTLLNQEDGEVLLLKERRVVDLSRAVFPKASPELDTLPPEHGKLVTAYRASTGAEPADLSAALEWTRSFSTHWPLLLAVSLKRSEE